MLLLPLRHFDLEVVDTSGDRDDVRIFLVDGGRFLFQLRGDDDREEEEQGGSGQQLAHDLYFIRRG